MHATGDMSSRYGVNVETDSSTISTGTGHKQEDVVEVAPTAPAPAPAPLPAPAAPVAAGPPQPPPPATFGHLPPVAPPPGGFTFGPPSNATADANAGGVNAAATAAAAAALAAPMPSAFPSLTTKKVAPVKKKKVKYCKAPGAPKRFKSAFIFFTMHRHKTIRKEIEEKLGKGDRVSHFALFAHFSTKQISDTLYRLLRSTSFLIIHIPHLCTHVHRLSNMFNRPQMLPRLYPKSGAT